MDHGVEFAGFLNKKAIRVRQCTGEDKVMAYHLQHLSVALQRGNTATLDGNFSMALILSCSVIK